MIAKEFLLEECDNVRTLLDSTLRFDYGPDGSAKFYEECSTRLEALRAALQASASTDERNLRTLSAALNELSRLICRIERSSINEYSWPFVEELKKISAAICREDTTHASNVPLPVFVLADGGLDSYQIFAERNRPSYTVNRLLTIVFPKTLKNFVLLHTILGHELGHAIFSCSQHQAQISRTALPHILHSGGQLENERATLDHIFSARRPPDISIPSKLDPNNFWQSHSWVAWIEEILCDLIGLTIFGPAFLAAAVSLLRGLDPSGNSWGPYHPPVAWRINLLRRACHLLEFDRAPAGRPEFAAAFRDFWDYIDGAVKTDPWYNILEDAHIHSAMQALHALHIAHSPAAYLPPDDAELENLYCQLQRRIPPVGFTLESTGKVSCREVDFRSILFAGWMSSKNRFDPVPFSLANKLCEHGIMQQRAISMTLQG